VIAGFLGEDDRTVRQGAFVRKSNLQHENEGSERKVDKNAPHPLETYPLGRPETFEIRPSTFDIGLQVFVDILEVEVAREHHALQVVEEL